MFKNTYTLLQSANNDAISKLHAQFGNRRMADNNSLSNYARGLIATSVGKVGGRRFDDTDCKRIY